MTAPIVGSKTRLPNLSSLQVSMIADLADADWPGKRPPGQLWERIAEVAS